MKTYKIAIITDNDRYLGFRLGSFSYIYNAKDSIECKSLICQLTAEKDYGIILVADKFISTTDQEMQLLLARSFPLIIMVPTSSNNKEENSHERILELIKRSIGYTIKF